MFHGSHLALLLGMKISKATIATAGIAALAAAYIRRQHTARTAAERFGAAALETLLYAIDANDPLTGAHVRRVAEYALILAEAAGLDDHDRRTVERVALFHDVGKIHEALFDIIHDKEKLSPAERRAISTHPQRGATVLSPLLGFYPELPAGVLTHHERWDGSGYPRGLKGQHIPLAARIVAIVDTFDAITHRRRYREGQPATRALDVIVEGRGTQFDPELVDLFMTPDVVAAIEKMRSRVARWHEPIEPRSSGREEKQVPDITFRWRPGRPGRHGGRKRPFADPAR